MSRDLIPAFRKGAIIKGTALEQVRMAATQPHGGNGAFVDGTGTYQRPMTRRERGIWFKPNTDVPAFGVMYVTKLDDTQGELVLETRETDSLALGEIIAINGPEDVGNGVYGKCHLAGDMPVRALVHSTSNTLVNGDACGPLPNSNGSFGVSKGLPGLVAFDVKEVEGEDDVVWVRQCKPHPTSSLRVTVPTSGTRTFPKYGVMPLEGFDLHAQFYTTLTGAEFYNYGDMGKYLGFGINAGDEVSVLDSESLKMAHCEFAYDRPALCLAAEPFTSSSAGDDDFVSYGLVPKAAELQLVDDYTLYPFLPGFRSLCHTIRLTTGEKKVILAMQDRTGPWWAKAKYDYTPSPGDYEDGGTEIECWPCGQPNYASSSYLSGTGTLVYDGVSLSPEIIIKVQVPYNRHGYPNIFEDNVFAYTINHWLNDLAPTGAYCPTLITDSLNYDDPLGTIKFWKGLTPPQGWEVILSTSPGDFLRFTDGSGTFGTSGAAYNWSGVGAIELIERTQ